jgi:hypothetical protein
MGRSVSYATGAVSVCYEHIEDDMESWDWEWYLERIQDEARQAFPSLDDCDYWLDREDHAIIENQHCYIGVSEYCGLVSIWLVPKDDNDHPELSANWCTQVTPTFNKLFQQLRKVGTFSNGEAIFERI